MAQRRTSVKRPPTSEEIQCWEQAAASMAKLMQSHSPAAMNENINTVNKLFASIPSDDAIQRGEGPAKLEITSALVNLKTASEKEKEAISHLLEELGILIALRQAPEQAVEIKRERAKRIRTSPPSSSIPSTPNGATSTPPLHTLAIPTSSAGGSALARSSSGISSNGRTLAPGGANGRTSSQGPSSLLKVKWPYANQLPLHPGRRVAFKQDPEKVGAGLPGDQPEGESATWIMAIVKKCINTKEHLYQVQDADDSEGNPQIYETTLQSMIPLPDMNAHPSQPSHPSQYKDHKRGSMVLGLYPDTTSFYRAEVIGVPKDPQPSGTRTAPGSSKTPHYRLRFEDDDNEIRSVPAELVVPCMD